ncbi:hypothetical protein Taro_028585, partial [Colocasia esculenta]|nr:hypothetical protein [Colocasia esculenta]
LVPPPSSSPVWPPCECATNLTVFIGSPRHSAPINNHVVTPGVHPPFHLHAFSSLTGACASSFPTTPSSVASMPLLRLDHRAANPPLPPLAPLPPLPTSTPVFICVPPVEDPGTGCPATATAATLLLPSSALSAPDRRTALTPPVPSTTALGCCLTGRLVGLTARSPLPPFPGFWSMEEPFKMWWNERRMWMLREAMSNLFAVIGFALKLEAQGQHVGLSRITRATWCARTRNTRPKPPAARVSARTHTSAACPSTELAAHHRVYISLQHCHHRLLKPSHLLPHARPAPILQLLPGRPCTGQACWVSTHFAI